jgi:hypothetical protein
MKKNNTTGTTPTVSNVEKKRLAQYKEKKTPWITKRTTMSNYGILISTLAVVLCVWLIAMCVGVYIANTNNAVKDAEGRGVVYTVEAVVVATDNTLHTVEDSDGTLWLIDSDTLSKGDALLLYIADNNTYNTQRDDVIVRVWIDTVQ